MLPNHSACRISSHRRAFWLPVVGLAVGIAEPADAQKFDPANFYRQTGGALQQQVAGASRQDGGVYRASYAAVEARIRSGRYNTFSQAWLENNGLYTAPTQIRSDCEGLLRAEIAATFATRGSARPAVHNIAVKGPYRNERGNDPTWTGGRARFVAQSGVCVFDYGSKTVSLLIPYKPIGQPLATIRVAAPAPIVRQPVRPAARQAAIAAVPSRPTPRQVAAVKASPRIRAVAAAPVRRIASQARMLAKPAPAPAPAQRAVALPSQAQLAAYDAAIRQRAEQEQSERVRLANEAQKKKYADFIARQQAGESKFRSVQYAYNEKLKSDQQAAAAVQAHYQAEMNAWRARVKACKAGDQSQCLP